MSGASQREGQRSSTSGRVSSAWGFVPCFFATPACGRWRAGRRSASRRGWARGLGSHSDPPAPAFSPTDSCVLFFSRFEIWTEKKTVIHRDSPGPKIQTVFFFLSLCAGGGSDGARVPSFPSSLILDTMTHLSGGSRKQDRNSPVPAFSKLPKNFQKKIFPMRGYSLTTIEMNV